MAHTSNIEIESYSIEAASPVSTFFTQSQGWYSILPLTTCEFPYEPLQSVRPVDEIQVAYTNEGAFVVAPLARSYATRLSVIERKKLAGACAYLTRPSFSPPSICLMMPCDAANTDHLDGSSEAP